MIVYRVADGKGWTKNTYAEAKTLAKGSTVQLSNITGSHGTLGSNAPATDTVSNDDVVAKIVVSDSQVTQVYVTKECNSSMGEV